MEYRLRIDEDIVSLKVERGQGDSLKLIRGDGVQEVGYTLTSPHHVHLVVDGLGVNAYVVPDGQGKTVIIRGTPYYLEDAARKATFKKRARAVPAEVTPPMPAVVVGVFVAEGDLVKQGDRVITVSAMKMETTLTAPSDGRVAAIRVAVGDKVRPGQILVDIQEEGGAAPTA
ncbi:MAG: biotin/lipoyl-containing protein [Thermodesulfobacteriota bacterium]